MDSQLIEVEVLPEKAWFALGRISKFLKSSYPYPDVRSGAYGYEYDREGNGDLFLQDLEAIYSHLIENPNMTERDLKRLSETFLAMNATSKNLTLEHQKYLECLKKLIQMITF